jgi:two-component system sensor histidine kinase YesM
MNRNRLSYLHSRLLKFWWGSIRAKFILSFILLTILPMILLAVFSYYIYLEILQGNVESYSREVIDRVDRNLQIYIGDLERILESRGDYYNVQFIKLSQAGDIEGNRKYTFRLWENLNSIKALKMDLRDVTITTLDGVSIGCYGVSHSYLTQNELFQTLVNRTTQDDKTVIWGPHPDWLGGKVFSVGRAIRGDYDNFLGMMTIDVDVELLDRICRNITLGQTGFVMLVDDDGQIIYHPKPEIIGKTAGSLLGDPTANQWKPGFFTTKIGSEARVVTVKTFVPANWKIIGLSNKAELTAEMQKVTGMTMGLIIATIIALTFVAVFLSGLLTKPIKELQNSMRQAAEDLNTNVRVRTHDEIGQLGNSFNRMLGRIRLLMEQSVQEQKKLRRAEMNALQEQIKPHFIYNTLDLIIGLLETKKNDDVINMVEALGAFFRTSLSHGQDFITIREETEHVRNYLFIQKMRHGDKYDYLLEIDERILGFRTIKLILQPLVENAIYHGVRELERPDGMITVKGYLDESGDKVRFEVIDNGVGMAPAKIDDVNHCLRDSGADRRFFGLCNVNERIVLAFGPEYGLQLQTAPGGGIIAVLSLPVVKISREDSDGHVRPFNG